MTEDLENSAAEMNVSAQEPLTAPLTSQPKATLEQLKSSQHMLKACKEAVKEGTYQGKHIPHITQLLMMLDGLIGQGEAQLQNTKRQQEDAKLAAKQAIKEAGGSLQEAANGTAQA